MLVPESEVMCMSVLDDATARGHLFDYLQLKAKMDHIKAEQDIVKAQLEALMTKMGVTQVVSAEGKGLIVVKHTYQFDVATIIKVVPTLVSKLKLSNEDFNKVLVGNEIALAATRKVISTTQSLAISEAKKK
jgi:ribosomal protein S17